VEFPVRQHVLLEPYYLRQNGSHSNPPDINALELKLNLIFCEAPEKDATDAAKEIAGRNNACSAPHEQPGPGFRTNLLRIKKARLSTRLGSGAETADHFTRLFFSRLRPCKSPWWNIGSLGLSRK
jgi:hypothetical protein